MSLCITLISEDSANPCLFQQCASDANNLALAHRSQDGSTLNLRYHVFIPLNNNNKLFICIAPESIVLVNRYMYIWMINYY